MTVLLIRFLVGGAIVTVFSLVGEVIGPKSLAGVFGAAPSVALATLPLTCSPEWQVVCRGGGPSYGMGCDRLLFVGVLLLCSLDLSELDCAPSQLHFDVCMVA